MIYIYIYGERERERERERISNEWEFYVQYTVMHNGESNCWYIFVLYFSNV